MEKENLFKIKMDIGGVFALNQSLSQHMELAQVKPFV